MRALLLREWRKDRTCRSLIDGKGMPSESTEKGAFSDHSNL